jgi:cysteine-S-conjugate beta-lyase
MNYDFDHPIERRSSDSLKWSIYPDDILPMWVADMDFLSPEPVLKALRERVDHGVFGYNVRPTELSEVISDRLKRLYDWDVEPRHIVYIPGVVTGFNLASRMLANDQGSVLVQTPVYPPILAAAGNSGMQQRSMKLPVPQNGTQILDIDEFAATIDDTSRVFILCNPHNPLGYVFTRNELEAMAEECLRHDTVICSDEIHSDLVFDGAEHIPIAALAPEIAQNTITLMAPSKTYNIAGLHCSVAVIQNEALRRQFLSARAGLVPEVGLMGFTAAMAGYRHGDDWLREVMAYLKKNRDLAVDYVNTQMPGVRVHKPDATYLTWLDCRKAQLPGGPHRFFLDQAGVALNNGADFGPGGDGFVRLNFGTRRTLLLQALERMRTALQTCAGAHQPAS